ncbi:MAG TPA: MFS transporter, partial [Dehalococcoidia bacterium]|nr:MFS transporter [Dehalococcoidia bacterium]
MVDRRLRRGPHGRRRRPLGPLHLTWPRGRCLCNRARRVRFRSHPTLDHGHLHGLGRRAHSDLRHRQRADLRHAQGSRPRARVRALRRTRYGDPLRHPRHRRHRRWPPRRSHELPNAHAARRRIPRRRRPRRREFSGTPRLEAGGQLSYLHGVRMAFRTVWRHPQLRTLIPFAAVIMAGTMATEYLTQPFLLSHDVDIGFAFSGLQVPIRITGVIGALLAFWFIARLGEVRTLLALPVIAILGYIGLAIWDALGAIALLALVGFVRSLAFPVVTGYINRRIPSDQRATVLSLNQVAFSLIV